jgi:predicted metalloprotease
MRLDEERESGNVEDRRGAGGGRGLVLGGAGTLIVVVIAMLMGADPRALLQQIQTQSVPTETTTPAPGGTSTVPGQADEGRVFVSKVLASTEDVWREQFRAMGRQYEEPTLVLFTDATESACGMAGSAMGPFYCPEDRKVYIDLGFYDELKQRFGAPGDFAQAYVIAHEVGHHVQNLLGISDRVRAEQQRSSKAEANELSVRLELQADFLAGVWAHHAQAMAHVLEPGDLEEALNAANAIGDDRLQMETQGRIVPDSFTHGTSAQRVRWFRKGWETGDIRQGDTFQAEAL